MFHELQIALVTKKKK